MRLPKKFRFLTGQFPDTASFINYLEKLRKWHVKNAGWYRALMKTPLDMNQTGVYRPALPLLLKELHKAGGVSAVKSFSETYDASGRRLFSAPWNSNAMKEYQLFLPPGSQQILVDVYSDGATISKSGSQSANSLRNSFWKH